MRSFKDLAKWYFSRRALPYWSILLLDSVLVVFAGLLAYTLHHGFIETTMVLKHLAITLGIFFSDSIIGLKGEEIRLVP